jgi:drug/metabolite transporter (DMT)-like permease
MKVKLRAYIDLTLAMFICGSAVVVSKMMVETIPTFLVTELGILIGMLILLPVTFIVKKESYKLDKRTFVILLGQALCGIFMYRVFTFWGLSFTSAANGGLISSSSPAIVVILAYIILKEKVSRNGLLGLIFVLIGLISINLYTYFSVATNHNSILGNLLIFAAVICEALFSVLSKIKCKKISPLYRTTIIVVIAFVCLLPFATYDAVNYNFSEMPSMTIGCIIYYGIFVTFLSYIFWFRGIEKVPVSKAALFTSVVPVSSILLAMVVLGERIKVVHVLGMLCIIAGILISFKNSKI